MFQGRYGNDRLNRTIFIAGIASSVLSLLFTVLKVNVVPTVFSVLSWTLLFAALWRMFSRNFYARQQELASYMRLENSVVRWWKSTFQKQAGNVRSFSRERKKFKYLVCPHCAQKLRVPRGKGKLRVTCTKCGYKFEAKS